MTVREMIEALVEVGLDGGADLPVWTEGCDCDEEAGSVVVIDEDSSGGEVSLPRRLFIQRMSPMEAERRELERRLEASNGESSG